MSKSRLDIAWDHMNGKTILGAFEKIKINGVGVVAKIDTGASRSSIDESFAESLKVGPVLKRSIIVSSHGKSVRPVIKAHVDIGGRRINAFFNISKRSHMRCRVLIGRNILKRGYLVDSSLDRR